MSKLFPAFLLSLFVTVFVISCQKDDDSIEINALKQSITALQKRSDSLAAALSVTNTNVTSLSKSIDSIKVQLAGIVLQISNLNSQLTQVNANIQSLTIQITLLNQQYADLLIKLNQILAQLSITNTSLSNGLVAYYPFTGNAGDSSGNANNGNINVGVAITSDRFGKSNSAYDFTGGTIVVPHKSYLTITQTGQFSISLWVYKSGTQNPAHIIGKRSQGSGSFNWQIAQHTTPAGAPGGGLIFTGVTNSTSVGIDYTGINDPVLQQNKWEHIVGTYNNGTWNLYKNGVLVAQKSNSLYAPDTNTPSMEIGNCGGWGAFWGKIDDIRIYNRTLTSDEITYLANH